MMEVILRISFLTLSNADIQFTKKDLTWKSYTAKKVLPITQNVKLTNKKEFAKAALNKNIEAFVVHMSSLSLRSKVLILQAWKA